MKDKGLVLDLDDTLYSEFDFLRSGYSFICRKLEPDLYRRKKLFDKLINLYSTNNDPFEYILKNYMSEDLTIDLLLNWYRYHYPDIILFSGVLCTLELLKNDFKFAIVTDGRSVTQRNKIKALKLETYIDQIIISEEIGSEKPDERNFFMVEEFLDCKQYIYVGDNLKKDFITPNSLGWKTICIKDSGLNIHKQDFNQNKQYLPHYIVDDWYEIRKLLINL